MNTIKEIEIYAKEFDIPIMQADGIEFLTDYIKKNNVKNILEIGSAIGYSAIRMALVDKDIKVVTIERDEKRFNEAVKNINDLELNKQIEVIFKDALEDISFDIEFDLIFIDAAKSKSIEFFNKYSKYLSKDGTIITDNINFHGLRIKKTTIKNRRTRSLMNKIDKYIEFLKEHQSFKTEFIELGDGIAITTRK